MQGFNCYRHLRRVIDLIQRIPPGAIAVQMADHILHEVPDAFASVVAGTFVVNIAKRR